MPIVGLSGSGVLVRGCFRMGRMVERKDHPGQFRPEATDHFVFTPRDLVRRVEALRDAYKAANGKLVKAASELEEKGQRAPFELKQEVVALKVEMEAIKEEAAAAKAELEAAVTVVREAFGVEPKVLVVQFPSDDIGAVFPHWLKLWSAKGLICKGDGERVAWRQDGLDGPVDRDGCLVCAGPRECALSLERGPKDKSGKRSPGCGPQGSLRFALDVLPGIFSLEIGSWRNCRRVLSGLNGLIGSVGGLRGYPVRVSLHPERDEADGRPVVVQVVDIVPAVATGVAREMWRAACGVGGGGEGMQGGMHHGVTEDTEELEGDAGPGVDPEEDVHQAAAEAEYGVGVDPWDDLPHAPGDGRK